MEHTLCPDLGMANKITPDYGSYIRLIGGGLYNGVRLRGNPDIPPPHPNPR